jgi:hypothetical protein
MRAAIHQPQYLPWSGYFFKILRSDIFVIFDTVQYPRGKHFGNRNRIKTAQGAQWLTVPVRERSELLTYQDIPSDTKQRWTEKHWRAIELAYRRAPYFDMYAAALRAIFLDTSAQNLSAFSASLLKFFLKALQCPAQIVNASALPIEKQNLDTPTYIFEILKCVGADTYISGQGAGSRRYIMPEQFSTRQIDLWFYDFTPPTYPQLWGEFVPELSILDMLLNCGPETRQLIIQNGKLFQDAATL